MSEIKDGGPAFPNPHYEGDDLQGMTLRDYFAAHVNISDFSVLDHVLDMRAARATYISDDPSTDEIADAIADLKFKVADAMLRARSQS